MEGTMLTDNEDISTSYHAVAVPRAVFMSFFMWALTYFVIRRTTGQDPEWAVRMVTAVHASLITILSTLAWLYFREWNIEKLGQTNSRYEELVLCLTLGYFIFDIMWITVHQTEGITMYFHHLASILCLAAILVNGSSAFEVLESLYAHIMRRAYNISHLLRMYLLSAASLDDGLMYSRCLDSGLGPTIANRIGNPALIDSAFFIYAGVSGLELTNPCLQARWFLRTYGYQGTLLYATVEMSFMVTFIVFRIFYGTYLTWNILVHPKCHFILKIGTISLYLVSWLFAYQMFSYLSKRYSRRGETC